MFPVPDSNLVLCGFAALATLGYACTRKFTNKSSPTTPQAPTMIQDKETNDGRVSEGYISDKSSSSSSSSPRHSRRSKKDRRSTKKHQSSKKRQTKSPTPDVKEVIDLSHSDSDHESESEALEVDVATAGKRKRITEEDIFGTGTSDEEDDDTSESRPYKRSRTPSPELGEISEILEVAPTPVSVEDSKKATLATPPPSRHSSLKRKLEDGDERSSSESTDDEGDKDELHPRKRSKTPSTSSDDSEALFDRIPDTVPVAVSTFAEDEKSSPKVEAAHSPCTASRRSPTPASTIKETPSKSNKRAVSHFVPAVFPTTSSRSVSPETSDPPPAPRLHAVSLPSPGPGPISFVSAKPLDRALRTAAIPPPPQATPPPLPSTLPLPPAVKPLPAGLGFPEWLKPKATATAFAAPTPAFAPLRPTSSNPFDARTPKEVPAAITPATIPSGGGFAAYASKSGFLAASSSSSASPSTPASQSSFATLLSKTTDSPSASTVTRGEEFAAFASTSDSASASSRPTSSASASTSGHSISKSTSVPEKSPKGASDSDNHKDSAPESVEDDHLAMLDNAKLYINIAKHGSDPVTATHSGFVKILLDKDTQKKQIVFWRRGVKDVWMNAILHPGMAKSNKTLKTFTIIVDKTTYRLKCVRDSKKYGFQEFLEVFDACVEVPK